MDGISKQVILHLSLIPSIGPSIIHAILKQFSAENSLEWVYGLSATDWQAKGFSAKNAQALFNGLRTSSLLHDELTLLTKYNIDFITWLDSAYPERLRHIHLPPVVLYYSGDLSLLNTQYKRLAVVGSRNGTSYAQRALNALLPPLIKERVVIVSGGARGVDAMAHSVTLASSGSTIAVLGAGLLRPYPKEHKTLFENIARNGLLISPFGLETEPLPGNFPARNRIVSGISEGCFVVQAAQRSGAKITAQFAREQGIDLFVLPGHFDDPLSEGCHELLKEGAELITNSNSLLAGLGISVSNKKLVSSAFEIISQQSNGLNDKLLAACKVPRDIDQLADELEIEFFELQQLLLTLQIEGALEQNMMGQWSSLKK